MMKELINAISKDNTDIDSYIKLADRYSEQHNWIAAISQYRSAIAIGSTNIEVYTKLAKSYLAIGRNDFAKDICEKILEIDKSNPASKNILLEIKNTTEHFNDELDHNTYFRMKSLSNHINQLFGNNEISILDIGGGVGYLSLFLPDSKYVLAEPFINGISALDLKFPDKMFDVVITCHVYEHIPKDQRQTFLDQLCKVAKKYVIMLNPFYSINNDVTIDAQKLVYELTGATWAKEHLECGMPKLEEITEYAKKKQISYRIIPNGSRITSQAIVFLDYFAGISGKYDELKKVHKLLNRYTNDTIVNDKVPNAYIVEFDVREQINITV